MPTYNYKCNTCGYRFEHFITYDEIFTLEAIGCNPAPSCKRCKSSWVKKVISNPTIIYKAEGFTKFSKENND